MRPLAHPQVHHVIGLSQSRLALMISALQCHPPVPSSATHQCPSAVPPISDAQQLHPSVPSSAASQGCQSVQSVSAARQHCPSVPPISSHQSCLSVPPISDHHCCLSVQQHQCLLISAQQ
ncbi:unnamed protein product, partial [Staurois parvus]